MLTVSGYQIISKVHESANTIVYRCRRHDDNRPVILKILKEDYPRQEKLTRFLRDYEITRGLELKGVIQPLSMEVLNNRPAIVSEDFGGESLQKLMRFRKLSLQECLEIFVRIAGVIGHIHTANLIHKGINPSNIVYNASTQELKIIDFGISTALSNENPLVNNPVTSEGSLAYISPEQTGRMNRQNS